MKNKLHKIYTEPTTSKVLIYLLNNRNHNKNYALSIAREIPMFYASVIKAINFLKEKGYINQYIKNKNQRTKFLTLTTKGKELAISFQNVNLIIKYHENKT